MNINFEIYVNCAEFVEIRHRFTDEFIFYQGLCHLAPFIQGDFIGSSLEDSLEEGDDNG